MSSKKPRPKREDPVRTGPHRNFAKLFRDADSWGPDGAENSEGGNGTGSGQPWDSAISRAVEMGYRVIEEEISQGRKAALEIAEKLTNPKSEDGDVSNLIGRVVRFYSDMGALWIEMLQSLARNPALINIVRTASSAAADKGAAVSAEPSEPASGSALPVEIVSSEPTGARVSLKIDDRVLGGTLSAHELRASGRDRQPIRDVVFEPGTDRWHPTLRITIPKGQAPGTYSGVVIDARTDEPCGTLCLRIPEVLDDGST